MGIDCRIPGFSVIAAACLLASACGGTNPARENANLANLVLEQVTLVPVFVPSVLSYSAEVAAAVDTTRVTPTAAVSSAMIEVNGRRVKSGSPGGPISLAPGDNTISIVVTARDGKTQRTYTVSVTRRATPGSNADLASLELTATELDQVFDGNLTSYTASVGHLAASTRVIAVPDDSFATLELDGEALAADEPSDFFALAPGTNTLDVAVAAEDETTTRTYDVEITRGELVSLQREAYVKASNPGPDFFGASVSLSCDTLVVGAPEEEAASAGIDGDETDNSFTEAGSTYVFERASGTWMQAAYIKASNPDPRDRFGDRVSIDDDTLVVGARGEQSRATGVDGDQLDNSGSAVGAAYVFERDGMGIWGQMAYLKASNSESGDEFGRAIELDGDRLVVGAPFEDSGATGINVNEDDESAGNAGAAYVFQRDSNGNWQQEAYLKASNTAPGDQFGHDVAINGRLAAVAATTEDSGAAGVDGDQFDNSRSGAGAVYVFDVRDNGEWSQVAYIKASNPGQGDNFGAAITLDGDLLVVGAPGEASAATGVDGSQLDNSRNNAGAAYVFERDGDSEWFQVAYIKASNTGDNDAFGSAVAVHGNVLVVGASGENSFATGINGDELDNSAPDAGAAYVFERDDSGVWTQIAYVKASNTGARDEFASALALCGDTLAVGAERENGASAGINGDESDDSLSVTGAVYVYR